MDYEKRWRSIFEDAKESVSNIKKLKANYNKIVFCGLGGSGMPGEILSSLNLDKPVFVAREMLPKWIDKRTLCFVISYSGNTKETLKLYNQVKKKSSKIVIISSGGKLLNKKENIKKIKVPENYLPRESLPYLLLPVLKMLGISFNFKPKKLENKAKAIAKKIEGKNIVIYAGKEKFKSVAFRWQTQLNENSKKLVHWNYYPELLHNEVEARDKRTTILLDDKENEFVKKSKSFFNPIKIKLEGKKTIDKILHGIYFGDLVSYYLAEMRGFDYKKTDRIDKIKAKSI